MFLVKGLAEGAATVARVVRPAARVTEASTEAARVGEATVEASTIATRAERAGAQTAASAGARATTEAAEAAKAGAESVVKSTEVASKGLGTQRALMGVAAVVGASAAPLGVWLGVNKLDSAARDAVAAAERAGNKGLHALGDGVADVIHSTEGAAKRAVGAVGLPSSLTGAAEGVLAIAVVGGAVYLVYEGYRYVAS